MHPTLKAHIDKNEFHHAYLLCGDFEACRKIAFEMAEAMFGADFLPLRGHPDFFYAKYELFGINDGHGLIYWASTRPIAGNKKIAVIEFDFLNKESSNALLKTLEEPSEGTHFFFISQSAESVIPTLRSRFVVIESFPGGTSLKMGSSSLAESFLKELPKKRLEIVKKMLPEKSQEKNADKNKAIELLGMMELILESRLRTSSDKNRAIKDLDKLIKAKEYIYDKGSSPKIILEHLALVLPKI